ncbi:MAG TPA: PAS domain S-box protein, partial [bacterium]|nr:PAS domain S-box protein [bacterium]
MTKIFIIEDEELIVRTYTTFLKSDYEVVGFAKSFDEALKKIEQNLPDIILCDIVIHGAKDGIDVCEKIQEKYDIPIIFISGYWDEKLFARAQKIRDCYYLLKPCKNQDIKNTIELAVNKKKSDNLLINSLLEGYVLTKIVYADDNKIDDLTILNVNHQIEKITKLSKTEICGKSLKYLYPPDCADDIKFLFNQISNIKNINIKEEFIFSPLFQKKHYQISIYSPKEHYLVFLIKDISLEKEQEFELLNLYYIFNLIPTNIVITDTGGKIIYVNSAFENVTGYYFSEVVGKKTCILKSGLLEKNFYRNLWTTILEGKIWRGEFYNRKKNGELYWERATIFSREDALGEITHFIKISENITTEKQQILEIIEYKNFIENIIKSLTDILIVCDIHGKIIRINKTFEEILEYQESEIINNPIDIIMLEFKDKNLNKAANNLGVKINEYVILGALKNYHTKFITKSGGEIDVSLSSSVVYDDKKNIKAIIFIAHDIRRRLKQEREQQRFLTLEKKQKFILNNLYDAAKIILENLQLDFDKIANKIFKILTKLTDADSGFIAVKNEYNNYQVIFIELGKKQCKLNYQLPIHLKLKGLSQHINAAQRSFIINNFQNTEWQNIIPQGHIEIDNLLISPILYDGVIYGLVALANKSTDFIEDDLMITEAIT